MQHFLWRTPYTGERRDRPWVASEPRMPFMAKRRYGVDPNVEERRPRGSTAVYEELREDILSLQIEPGAPLDEVALAKRFGVSRTPIREALIMLSSELLVRFLPSRSAIVAPHTMANTSEYLDALILHARSVARLAALRRTDRALEELRDRQKQYEAATADLTDIDRIVAADLAFHNAIADAGGNEFFCRFFALTLDYGRRMMLLNYYTRFDPMEAERTRREHASIVDAIAAGDDDRADDRAVKHIRSFVKVIQKSLEPSCVSAAQAIVGSPLGSPA
jgi:DNA-binding GntR family transcriptional regulator